MNVSNPSTVNNASATPTPYASRPASASATENPSSDTVSQVKQAEQPKPVEATSNYPVKIEKVPFEIGVSSATVERIAKQNSCESTKGAGLLYKKGPVEVYRVDCKDGREIKARCELRQCNIFTP
jgi:hypothetical protein